MWKCLIIPLKLILLALLIALTVSSGIYRCLSNIFNYPVACIKSFFKIYSFFWISTYFDVYLRISYSFSLKYVFIYWISPYLTYSNSRITMLTTFATLFGVLLAIVAFQERIPAYLDIQLVSCLPQFLRSLLYTGLNRIDLSKSWITTWLEWIDEWSAMHSGHINFKQGLYVQKLVMG